MKTNPEKRADAQTLWEMSKDEGVSRQIFDDAVGWLLRQGYGYEESPGYYRLVDCGFGI